jgi:glycosyltransferase involved in cell wall biosynthesis
LELLSYLAAGTPVAAPDTAADHHCLRAGQTAWLFPPADPGTLAITLGMILRNPGWAGELANAGRDHVHEHHSWDKDAASFVSLVEERVGNQVSPAGPLLNQ